MMILQKLNPDQGGNSLLDNRTAMVTGVTPEQLANDMVVTSDTVVAPTNPEWHRLSFPLRLYHLLNFMEREGLQHMAHWGDGGRCFRIARSEELVENILPYFFQQNKWKSFQRQINIYDFKRVPSGPFKGYYRHPCFSRFDMSQVHKIQRKKQRSELSAQHLSPETGNVKEMRPEHDHRDHSTGERVSRFQQQPRRPSGLADCDVQNSSMCNSTKLMPSLPLVREQGTGKHTLASGQSLLSMPHRKPDCIPSLIPPSAVCLSSENHFLRNGNNFSSVKPQNLLSLRSLLNWNMLSIFENMDCLTTTNAADDGGTNFLPAEPWLLSNHGTPMTTTIRPNPSLVSNQQHCCSVSSADSNGDEEDEDEMDDNDSVATIEDISGLETFNHGHGDVNVDDDDASFSDHQSTFTEEDLDPSDDRPK